MTQIISLCKGKGGAGATTLAVALAYEYAQRGKTILLDCDPQGSATKWSKTRKKNELECPFEVRANPVPTVHEDVVALSKDYEFIILDTPPRASDLLKSVMLASDIILIPFQPSPMDVQEASVIGREIIKAQNEVSRTTNRKINLMRGKKVAFVLTCRESRTILTREAPTGLVSFNFPILQGLTRRTEYPKAWIGGQLPQEISRLRLFTQSINSEVKALVNEISTLKEI